MKFINQPINSSIEKTFANTSSLRVGGVGEVDVEYITNFIASRSSYAMLASQISVSTAYKIRADVQFKSGVVADSPIVGRSAGFSHVFEIGAAGILTLTAQFASASTTSTITRDDLIHEVEVELSGNDFIFRVDGVHFETVTQAAAAAQPFTFNAVATRNSTEFFDGFIQNLHIEESSVVVSSLPMSESFSEPDFANETDPSNPATKINISADQVIEI